VGIRFSGGIHASPGVHDPSLGLIYTNAAAFKAARPVGDAKLGALKAGQPAFKAVGAPRKVAAPGGKS
jgi:hypothetical protein